MMSGMHIWWWGLIPAAFAVVWLMWQPARSQWDGSRDAEKLARRMYAAGEIDESEFRERLATLRRE